MEDYEFDEIAKLDPALENEEDIRISSSFDESGPHIGKFENCAGDFQTGVKMAQIVSKFESTNAHISTVELI